MSSRNSFCGTCGRFIDDKDARYCRTCGASLVQRHIKNQKVFDLPKIKLAEMPTAFAGYFSSPKSQESTEIPLNYHRYLSIDEQEILNAFRHLRDQIDLTNSESELKSLLNESEMLRRSRSQSADQYFMELLSEEHLSVAKKVRSRAAYISFKQSAKFAAGVATKLLFI